MSEARVAEMEAERVGLVEDLTTDRASKNEKRRSKKISETDVRAALIQLLERLRSKQDDVREMRAALASRIDRVKLDPVSERCVMHYA